MKVYHLMTSGGNAARGQHVIQRKGGSIFQSYGSTVAMVKMEF